MARKPANFEWLGLIEQQIHDLDLLDVLGDHNWIRNKRLDTVMPILVLQLDQTVSRERVKQRMADIGHDDGALRMLGRWYVRATTCSWDPPFEMDGAPASAE